MAPIFFPDPERHRVALGVQRGGCGGWLSLLQHKIQAHKQEGKGVAQIRSVVEPSSQPSIKVMLDNATKHQWQDMSFDSPRLQ